MTAVSEHVDNDIRRTDDEGIITLTFTRDQKLNSVTREMLGVIRTAVHDLDDHEEHRALLLMAEGRYYTAGADIGEMGPQPESGVAMRRDYRHFHELFDEMERVEKPVVLAAQGPCLGLGIEMGSSCDFRFASERATFGLPEVPMLSVLPGSGGVSRFTRLVGPHWARWVAMAGETVDAELARTMGWVHQVLPEDGFHEAVHDWTRNLVRMSAEALGLAKIAIDAAVDSDRRTARHIDRVANTQLVQTQEHLDKIAAFNERSVKKG